MGPNGLCFENKKNPNKFSFFKFFFIARPHTIPQIFKGWFRNVFVFFRKNWYPTSSTRRFKEAEIWTQWFFLNSFSVQILATLDPCADGVGYQNFSKKNAKSTPKSPFKIMGYYVWLWNDKKNLKKMWNFSFCSNRNHFGPICSEGRLPKILKKRKKQPKITH